jgi:hypothetical protein
MIAYTGKIMLEHGVTLPLEKSQIRPGYRADEVEVTWREDEPGEIFAVGPHEGGTARGAEAVVEIGEEDVVKRRVSKRYRSPALDRRLITERTRAEARLIATARRAGVPTPVIRDITADTIVMERIRGDLLKYVTTPETIRLAGRGGREAPWDGDRPRRPDDEQHDRPQRSVRPDRLRACIHVRLRSRTGASISTSSSRRSRAPPRTSRS